jgi:hypothetical protein
MGTHGKSWDSIVSSIQKVILSITILECCDCDCDCDCECESDWKSLISIILQKKLNKFTERHFIPLDMECRPKSCSRRQGCGRFGIQLIFFTYQKKKKKKTGSRKGTSPVNWNHRLFVII